MTRTVVILSLLLAACDVGSIEQGSTGTDGGGSGSGSGSNCETINAANAPDGHHTDQTAITQATAMQGCMSNAGCHNEAKGLGTGAPAYTYAGTLFKDTAGTQPLAGATIFVKLGATEKKVVTANNGNFWFVGGVAGIEAPTNAMTAQTRASACPPPDAAMVGALVQGGGDCNSCHKTPGGTTLPMYIAR
jgi:hypothetical protein